MRITVTYFDGYPELEKELAKHPPRARAERLRFLAALGLALMNNRTAMQQSTKKTRTANPNEDAKKSITRSIIKQVDE